MKSLEEVQRWMAAALRERAALPRDVACSGAAAEIATGSSRLSPVEQLEIYRRQYWLRHTSLLVEDFAALGALLGQKSWERLVEGYLSTHPPTTFELRHLGRELPRFVETCDWLPHHELCVDLARVEASYLEVFDAADSAPLRPEQVAAVPEDAWPTSRLLLCPALRLLELNHRVAELRSRLRRDERDVPLPEREPVWLVVYRGPDRELHHAPLGPSAFRLLSELGAGAPLGAACEAVVAERPEAAAELESSLGGWLADFTARGWIVGIEL